MFSQPKNMIRLAVHLTLLKGIYPHNFERALKSMTCVQTGSIHIDGFKNAKKNSKWYSVAMATNQNPQKGAKNVFLQAKISPVREIVQNLIFDMLL